jgi:hypothetical protein
MRNNSVSSDPQSYIKKEARATDYTDLGEVQEVGMDFILTQKGILKREIFSIPRGLFDRFDGDYVWFRITEEEAKHYSSNKKDTID